jgi:glycosyltransferase involved in cell wall biosynthesis
VSSSSDLRTIAFLPPRLVSGGTQRHLLEVLRFIDRGRFRPIVVSAKSGGELGGAVRALDVELVELHLGERMLSGDLVRCVRETAAVVRERQVDIVQSFAWRPGLIALGAIRLAGRGRFIAGRRSTPQERAVRGLLEELVVQLADRVVVNAESLRPRGRAGRRTVVVPSGVDSERFRPRVVEQATARTALGVAADRPLIGTVGRLEARKGTAVLLDALARLHAQGRHDVQLAIAGDGPLRAELTAQAGRLGVREHVSFLGDRGDVREVLAALDVFVLPSFTEGMSNALLEAMAMELPVVATRVGGTPEVLATGASGLLVPPGDPAAIAEAVGRLLATPAERERLGHAARRRIEEGYDVRAMVRRLESVYAAVAAPSGMAAPLRRAAAGEAA